MNYTDFYHKKQGFWKVSHTHDDPKGWVEFYYKDDEFIGKAKAFCGDGFQYVETEHPKGLGKIYWTDTNQRGLASQSYFTNTTDLIRHGLRIIHKEKEEEIQEDMDENDVDEEED